MVEDSIDVSVVMLTYFHEDYIAQALDSVLSQETTVRYEILIGDDASQDRTPDIIREYAQRYPDIIRAVLRTENVGAAMGAISAGGRGANILPSWRETTTGWTPEKCRSSGIFWRSIRSIAAAVANA